QFTGLRDAVLNHFKGDVAFGNTGLKCQHTPIVYAVNILLIGDIGKTASIHHEPRPPSILRSLCRGHGPNAALRRRDTCEPDSHVRNAVRRLPSAMYTGAVAGSGQSAWNVFCAAASPSEINASTASAARSTSRSRSLRSAAEKSFNTNAAGSIRPGGRPTPNRTRR